VTRRPTTEGKDQAARLITIRKGFVPTTQKKHPERGGGSVCNSRGGEKDPNFIYWKQRKKEGVTVACSRGRNVGWRLRKKDEEPLSIVKEGKRKRTARWQNAELGKKKRKRLFGGRRKDGHGVFVEAGAGGKGGGGHPTINRIQWSRKKKRGVIFRGNARSSWCTPA